MGQEMEPVDADLVGESNQTQKHLEELEDRFYTWMMVSRVLIIIVTLVGIFFSILIMRAIRKFPKLHTRVNHYIFHMLLCLVIYYIVRPFLVSLYCVISGSYYMVIEMMRVVWNFEQVALVLMFIFANALAIDWYAQVYNKESWIRIQNKSYKFIICLLYLLAVFKICLYFALTIQFFETVLAFFFISCIVITICNCIKCCSSRSVDVDVSSGLRVANVSVYAWSPPVIYMIIFHFFMSDNRIYLEKPLAATMFIPQLIVSCIPVIIFFILKKKDRDFEAAFAVLLHLKQSYENNQLETRGGEKV